MATARRTVFISYARADRAWADELLTFLAPWIRTKRVALWDDSRIRAGDDWQNEIQKAIEEATVAVLLVTKDFLASNFIADHELPLILQRARKNEIRIAWVAVGFSGFEATEIGRLQAVNNPTHPMETLGPVERNKAMVDIAKQIADAVTIGTFAGGLRIVDETSEPLEAALYKRPVRADRKFHVQANYEPAGSLSVERQKLSRLRTSVTFPRRIGSSLQI